MSKKWLWLLLLLGASKAKASPTKGKLTALPLASATETSPFGFRYHPAIKGHPWKHHNGLDLGAPAGSPVFAAGDGVVLKAGWTTGGYGNKVEIDHGEGLVTKYGHMLELPLVVTGERVQAGQQIGKVGSTGLSTGTHLHFETWVNGKVVDPKSIFPEIKKF